MNSIFYLMYLGFYLFPDGRFVPRWTRWIMFTGIGVSIFLIIFPRYSSALLNTNPGSKISRLLLGFSLEEIKHCLQIGPTVLQESLSPQKAMMQEKRTQLANIIQAIEETEQLLPRRNQRF